MLKQFKMFVMVLPLLFVAGINQAMAEQEMVIEKASPLDFDQTVERLISNAKELGWKVPKKWAKDFQENLNKVTDVDIGKALVVEMCEPFAASELLVHDKYKKFLSMMPCSVAVYEKSDGKVYLSMMNIHLMGQMYKGQKEIDKLIANLAPQMEQMLDMQ